MHLALLAPATLASILLLPVASSPPQERQMPPDESLVCMFDAGVDQYVQLHRRLEQFVRPQIITPDPALLFVSRTMLAAEIRGQRPFARQGDIFSPEIAAYFRRVIARTLREDGIDFAVFFREDGMTLPLSVRVNGDYPADGAVATMPPTVLSALPPLPPELQYRFVNFDLILWDVHAGLIVDFVPNVFGRTTHP